MVHFGSQIEKRDALAHVIVHIHSGRKDTMQELLGTVKMTKSIFML
jgi:hypothetical protein